MKRIPAILFLLLLSFRGYAQLAFGDGKYKNFLSDSDQSYVRMVGLGMYYQAMPFDDNFKAIGLSQQLHFNLARFFTGKMILGIEVDVRGAKGFVHKKFTGDFGNQLAAGLHETFSSQRDSSLAGSLVNAVQGEKICRGNYFSDLGIVFSPFPYKWGGIVVSYKRGQRNYPVFVSGKYYESDSDDWEYVLFNVERVHSLELRVHPVLFFKQQEIGFGKPFDYAYISFFCEWKNYHQANFSGSDLDNLFRPETIDAAFQRRSFGFRAGMWLK